jgi:glutamate--cysteine ligase
MKMPLAEIVKRLSAQEMAIDAWFAEQWQGLTPLPYFSCDIRHSADKIGIVDTNLFPAGFNNLCKAYSREVSEAFQAYLSEFYPQAKTIGLLAETHTRNKFYLANIQKLQSLLQNSGHECLVTMALEPFNEPLMVPLNENAPLTIYPPDVKGEILFLAGKKIDLLLSNNDFTSGIPIPFTPMTSAMIPAPSLGWHKRSKSQHFKILNQLINEFASRFAFDPWLMTAYAREIDNIDESDLNPLAEAVQHVLDAVQKKYTEYEISDPPYVFIKNNAGTYGLGVISVNSVDELLKLNRKQRQKLFSGKAGLRPQSFLIQEGIPTADTYSDFPIEPVIYGIGKKAVAGFFRIHEGKNRFESLNSPGMSFSCLCLHKLDELHEAAFINCCEKERLVSVSKAISRFAALAAAKEAQTSEASKLPQ